MGNDEYYNLSKAIFKFWLALLSACMLYLAYGYLCELHDARKEAALSASIFEYHERVIESASSEEDIESTEGCVVVEATDKSESAVYLQLSEYGRVKIQPNGFAIIDKNDNDNSYMLSIPLGKTCQDIQAEYLGLDGNVFVGFEFSKFDPQISLQDNINIYLNSASIAFYPDREVCPRELPEKINEEPLL